MNRRPPWGWLYSSAALALAPLVLVTNAIREGALRTFLEVVAAMIVIGALALWVRVNRIALELQGRRDYGWRHATMTAATSARPADLALRDHAIPGPSPRRNGHRARPVRQKGPRHEGFASASRG